MRPKIALDLYPQIDTRDENIQPSSDRLVIFSSENSKLGGTSLGFGVDTITWDKRGKVATVTPSQGKKTNYKNEVYFNLFSSREKYAQFRRLNVNVDVTYKAFSMDASYSQSSDTKTENTEIILYILATQFREDFHDDTKISLTRESRRVDDVADFYARYGDCFVDSYVYGTVFEAEFAFVSSENKILKSLSADLNAHVKGLFSGNLHSDFAERMNKEYKSVRINSKIIRTGPLSGDVKVDGWDSLVKVANEYASSDGKGLLPDNVIGYRLSDHSVAEYPDNAKIQNCTLNLRIMDIYYGILDMYLDRVQNQIRHSQQIFMPGLNNEEEAHLGNQRTVIRRELDKIQDAKSMIISRIGEDRLSYRNLNDKNGDKFLNLYGTFDLFEENGFVEIRVDEAAYTFIGHVMANEVREIRIQGKYKLTSSHAPMGPGFDGKADSLYIEYRDRASGETIATLEYPVDGAQNNFPFVDANMINANRVIDYAATKNKGGIGGISIYAGIRPLYGSPPVRVDDDPLRAFLTLPRRVN